MVFTAVPWYGVHALAVVLAPAVAHHAPRTDTLAGIRGVVPILPVLE